MKPTKPTKPMAPTRPLPPIGFGTSPGAGLRPAELAPAIDAALDAGFRLFDTAEVYGSEPVLRDRIAASGIPRSELFLVSKLWQTNHAFSHAIAACEGSLRRLGVDQLDLYLIHSPESWRHAGPLEIGPDVAREEIEARAMPRSPDGGPAPGGVPIEETWAAMIELKRRGLVRAIGVANFDVGRIEALAESRAAAELPEAVQAEIHPGRPEDDLVRHCRRHGIAAMAHSPLGGGGALRDPRMVEIARALGASPAQAVLRWHIERGVVPIPGSHRPEHAREDWAALTLEP